MTFNNFRNLLCQFLAALGARTPRNIGALLLAAAGGWLLTDARFSGSPLGFVFAFANCILFILYIMLGHRIAEDGGTAGIDRLGASMLIALMAVSPLGLTDALPVFTVNEPESPDLSRRG